MKKKGLLILFSAILVCGCTQSPDLTPFTEQDLVRIEVSGDPTFHYNPLTCQMSYNAEKMEFRVNTDTMSDYFIVKLHGMPLEVGREVGADVSWTTATDVESRKNITLRLVDKQGDKYWLWDSNYRIGVEVRTLE